MTVYFSVAIIVAIILIAWTAWGFFGSRVEQAKYKVVKKMRGYEIRKYSQHIEAQVTVKGQYEQALNEGFVIIAGYIFGANTKKEKIAMTAPVTEQKLSSEKIAMTAPVLATTDGSLHVVAFGMPSAYTLQTLPVPSDSRIKIVSVPEKTFAVMHFGAPRTESKTLQTKNKLLLALKKDLIQVLGQPIYAGYNAPWTPPWMSRNEIMVEIIN